MFSGRFMDYGMNEFKKIHSLVHIGPKSNNSLRIEMVAVLDIPDLSLPLYSILCSIS